MGLRGFSTVVDATVEPVAYAGWRCCAAELAASASYELAYLRRLDERNFRDVRHYANVASAIKDPDGFGGPRDP